MPVGDDSRVLLPEKVRQGENIRSVVWPPAGKSGFVGLPAAQVHSNLVWLEALDPRGVSAPWSPALAYEWRLSEGHERSRELLRLVLLAQFMGLLTQRRLPLKPDGTHLAKLLHAAAPGTNPHGVDLVLFEWQRDVERRPASGSGSIPGIVAASLVAGEGGGAWRWTLFPATAYQSDDGVGWVRHVLQRERGAGSKDPRVGEHGGRLEPNDSDARDSDPRARFYGLLAALAELPAKVDPQGPWKSQLKALAGDARPLPLQALDGLIPPDVIGGDDIWQCSGHAAEGQEWSLDAKQPELVVSSDTRELRCARHNAPLRNAVGPVPVESLGAARIVGSAGAELLIWSDNVTRDPNLRVVKQESGELALTYRLAARIRLKGRMLALAEIQCPSLVVPDSEGQRCTTIPIKSDRLGLIEGQARWDAGRRGWEVSLRGRNHPEFLAGTTSDASAPFSGLVAWPKTASPNWRAEVVAANVELADEAALVERKADGRVVVGEFRPQPLLLSPVDGTAAFVAVKRDGNEHGALQVDPIEPATPASAPMPGFIAIDFGTSNTTVMYDWAGRHDPQSVYNGVASAVQFCRLPSAGANFLGPLVEQSLAIFSSWHERADAERSPLLGTLLVERLGGERRLHASVVPRDPTLVGNLVASPQTRVHDNLKWQHMEDYAEAAVKTYLERVLLPAFRELDVRKATSVVVAATYPLAFDGDRRNRFELCMKSTVQALCERSGLTLDGGIRYYSESQAGMKSAAATAADYTLTVDMGGGTTDLAVLGPDGRMLADSLRIGGRSILRALTVDQKREKVEARLVQRLRGGVVKLGVSYETLIEALLQSRDIAEVIAAVQPSDSLASRKALAALLSAIVVAARRILHCALPPGDQPIDVNLHLLGQGWHVFHPRLTKGFSIEHFSQILTDSKAQQRFRLRDKTIDLTSQERKLQVVRGAIELLCANAPTEDEEARCVLGFDFKTKTETLLAHRAVREVGVPQLSGDPGLEPVIEELLEVMPQVCDGLPLGDARARLNERAGPSKTHLAQLIDRGSQEIERSIDRQKGLTRSPLMTFLSGPWAEFWTQ